MIVIVASTLVLFMWPRAEALPEQHDVTYDQVIAAIHDLRGKNPTIRDFTDRLGEGERVEWDSLPDLCKSQHPELDSYRQSSFMVWRNWTSDAERVEYALAVYDEDGRVRTFCLSTILPSEDDTRGVSPLSDNPENDPPGAADSQLTVPANTPRTVTLADFVGQWESVPISLSVEAGGKCFCTSQISIGNSGVVTHEFGNRTIVQKDGRFTIAIQNILWALRLDRSGQSLVLQAEGNAKVTPRHVVLSKVDPETDSRNTVTSHPPGVVRHEGTGRQDAGLGGEPSRAIEMLDRFEGIDEERRGSHLSIAFAAAALRSSLAKKDTFDLDSWQIDTRTDALNEDDLKREFGAPDQTTVGELHDTDSFTGLPMNTPCDVLQYEWLRILVINKEIMALEIRPRELPQDILTEVLKATGRSSKRGGSGNDENSGTADDGGQRSQMAKDAEDDDIEKEPLAELPEGRAPDFRQTRMAAYFPDEWPNAAFLRPEYVLASAAFSSLPDDTKSQVQQRIREFESRLGVTVSDVDGVSLAGHGDQGLVVLRSKKPFNSIELHNSSESKEVGEHQGTTLYKMADPPIYYALPDPDLLIVAQSISELRLALDRGLNSRKTAEVDPDIDLLIDAANLENAAGVIPGTAGNAGTPEWAKHATNMTLEVKLRNELKVSFIASYEDEESAKQASIQLENLKFLMNALLNQAIQQGKIRRGSRQEQGWSQLLGGTLTQSGKQVRYEIAWDESIVRSDPPRMSPGAGQTNTTIIGPAGTFRFGRREAEQMASTNTSVNWRDSWIDTAGKDWGTVDAVAFGYYEGDDLKTGHRIENGVLADGSTFLFSLDSAKEMVAETEGVTIRCRGNFQDESGKAWGLVDAEVTWGRVTHPTTGRTEDGVITTVLNSVHADGSTSAFVESQALEMVKGDPSLRVLWIETDGNTYTEKYTVWQGDD